MTEDKTTDDVSRPVAGPVQRPVRPLVERLEAAAHAWENSLTICGDLMPSPAMLREAKAEIELLRKTLELQQRKPTIEELRGELWVLLQLRVALGDPTGELMQDELVERARDAWADAQLYRMRRAAPGKEQQ